ncbi:hypothetical protein [Ideonella paludis]|uniref:hypothetical protein n=1 Tax=Ideonella paludis TaxID=1233411 RepID=UPI0036436F24
MSGNQHGRSAAGRCTHDDHAISADAKFLADLVDHGVQLGHQVVGCAAQIQASARHFAAPVGFGRWVRNGQNRHLVERIPVATQELHALDIGVFASAARAAQDHQEAISLLARIQG